MSHFRRTIQVFVDASLLTGPEAEEALREAALERRDETHLRDLLVRRQICDEAAYYRTIAAAAGVEFLDLKDFKPSPKVVALVHSRDAHLSRVFPLEIREERLRVALGNPLNFEAVEDMEFSLGRSIEVVMAPQEQIDALIEQFYPSDITFYLDEKTDCAPQETVATLI
jgi:type IV pilus assembly protein PilB